MALDLTMVRGVDHMTYELKHNNRLGVCVITNGHTKPGVITTLDQQLADLTQIDYKMHIFYDQSGQTLVNPNAVSSMLKRLKQVIEHPNCGQVVVLAHNGFIRSVAEAVAKMMKRPGQIIVFTSRDAAEKYINSLL